MSREHIIEHMAAQINELKAENEKLREANSPCQLCGYGGKALDAPPCTECPAHPKKAVNEQKGCEHCLTEYDREDWRDGNPHDIRIAEFVKADDLLEKVQALIKGNNLFTYSTSDGWESKEIRFCPWCGRFLEGCDEFLEEQKTQGKKEA